MFLWTSLLGVNAIIQIINRDTLNPPETNKNSLKSSAEAEIKQLCCYE